MFGSKKKKEQQEIARAAAVAEREEALAGFQKRAEDVAAMTDMGERLFALNDLASDVKTRIQRETQKILIAESKAPGAIVGAPGFLVGLGSGIALLFGAPLVMVGVGIGVCVGGVATGLVMDEAAHSKPVKLGLYDPAFVEQLEALAKDVTSQSQVILEGQYDALATSKVFAKVVESYPSIEKAFAARALKAAEKKKQLMPPPQPRSDRGGQDFTL